MFETVLLCSVVQQLQGIRNSFRVKVSRTAFAKGQTDSVAEGEARGFGELDGAKALT